MVLESWSPSLSSLAATQKSAGLGKVGGEKRGKKVGYCMQGVTSVLQKECFALLSAGNRETRITSSASLTLAVTEAFQHLPRSRPP